MALFLCLILAGCGTAPQGETNEEKSVSHETSPTEKLISFSGDFLVSGYPTLENIHESFCEDRDCPSYRYVYFNVLSTENSELQEHLMESADYLRHRSMRIGLGCLDNDRIHWTNDSDERGQQEQQLSAEFTIEVMAATMADPISLHLIKLPNSKRIVSPACSSEFSTIEKARN